MLIIRLLLIAMGCCIALCCQGDSTNDESSPVFFSIFLGSSFEEDLSINECPRDAYCDTETQPFRCVCKDGFQGDGHNCTANATCKRPPSLRFGKWSRMEEIRLDRRFYPGDRIYYTCQYGYAIKCNNGKKIRQCKPDGQWYPSKKPACVVAKCDAPDGKITNGSSTAIPNRKYRRGETVEYSCFPGYRVKGSSLQTCISSDSLNGSWSTPPPTCEVIQCPDVGYPENSNRIGRPPFFIGDEVRFRCASGYTLIGSESRTCQKNAKWSGTLTVCDSGNGQCRNPGTPINGRKEGHSYNFGDIVKFYCYTGFILVGSKERSCLKTGEWSGRMPKCKDTDYEDYDDIDSVAHSFEKTLGRFIDTGRETLGRTIPLNSGSKVEIYIAIDGSGSIVEEDFKRSIMFAKALIKKTGISRSGTMYGALVYSDRIVHKTDITGNKYRILGELEQFTYSGGGTSTTLALKEIHEKMIPLAKRMYGNNTKDATETKRFVIILTDGASNTGGDPIDTAQKLKRLDDVEIYVIGIGVRKINQELVGLASTDIQDEDDDHILLLKDYNDLERLANKLVGKDIDYSICGVGKRLAQTTGRKKRIVGGTESENKDWPWQAALWDSQNKFFCGGSILSKHWIMTAAHCFEDKKLFKKTERGQWHEKVSVSVGYTDISAWQGEAVEEVITHPGYSNYNNDIALLKLKVPLEFGESIQPICLPNKTKDSHILSIGDMVITTGWGDTRNRTIDETKRKTTDHLHEASLKVKNLIKCAHIINKTQHDYSIVKKPVTKNMFCAGNGYPSTCQGDSGGPVIKKIPSSEERDEYWVQFGIVSFGYGCGVVGQIDVMSYIPELIDWIQNVTLINFS